MKRFTETEKWRDPWFRKLSPGAKLAFAYIVDNCDNAGVWDCDTELADFTIGMAIPWEKVLEAFGDRIDVLPCGKWHLTRFVQFQFGKLSPDCKPHQSVLRLLEKHRVSKGYPNPLDTHKEKEKDKDRGEESAERGGKKAKGTAEEIRAYCVEIGLPDSDGQALFDKWEGSGWKNNGKPIMCWRSTIRSWRAIGCLPSQKNGASPTPKPPVRVTV